MRVLEPGTSLTCSASSIIAFFPLPRPPPLIHSPILTLTVAFLPAPSSRRQASCTPLFPPQRQPNRRWVFSTWLNSPICALSEVLSGWLCAKATQVAKCHIPLSHCWILIQTHSEADSNKRVLITAGSYKINTFFHQIKRADL